MIDGRLGTGLARASIISQKLPGARISLRSLRKLKCHPAMTMLELSVSDQANAFASRGSADQVEEGLAFQPKFDADGLMTCVVTDAASGELLMVAHMNAEALRKTIESGDAWYFSRSRKQLWRKGESSGHAQRVVELRVDCDQDALWLKVEQQGPGACHTGRRSCFYRALPLGKAGAALEFREEERMFDPGKVYDDK
jgi:phosphoribosyl-AMP cyclohydrolase